MTVASARRLAAIMFTDIAGFTGLTQADESAALKLLGTHNQLLRPMFLKFNGREVKAVGDSFLVEFDSALDAARCAIEIQQVLHDYNVSAPDESKIWVRIGIHLGDVVHTAHDVLGDAVNLAARIEPLSEPGSVCISEQVFAQVRNKIPNALERHEPRALKNVRFPMDIYRVVPPWEAHPTEAARSESKGLRIVVLPFVNLSPDPADAYFTSGITEELISAVSRIRELSVISRTSAMRYSGGQKPLKEIGAELRVGYALEGSVRKAGDTVRISAQLVDVAEDRQLWSEKFDRTLNDVFAVQGDVAEQVARSLKTTLVPGARVGIARTSPRSTEAHVLYLRGRASMPLGHSGIAAAIRLFERALEKDPDYALALAALAECYTYAASETVPDAEALPKATEYARRAVFADPELSDAHASLGIIALQRDLDVVGAETELRRALDINPSNSAAHLRLGTCLRQRGLHEEALSEVRTAEEFDPLSPFVKWYVAYGLVAEQRLDMARMKCEESLELDSHQVYPHALLSFLHRFAHEAEAAIAEGRIAVQTEDTVSFGWEALGCAYATAGRIDDARQVIEKIEQLGAKGMKNACSRAVVELSLGNREEALRLLEQADQERDATLLFRFGLGVLAELNTEPRFVQIARKHGWEIRSGN